MDTHRQKVKDEVAAVERGPLPKPFRHLSLATVDSVGTPLRPRGIASRTRRDRARRGASPGDRDTGGLGSRQQIAGIRWRFPSPPKCSRTPGNLFQATSLTVRRRYANVIGPHPSRGDAAGRERPGPVAV